MYNDYGQYPSGQLKVKKRSAYASVRASVRAKIKNAYNHFLIKLEYVLGHFKHFENFENFRKHKFARNVCVRNGRTQPRIAFFGLS